MPMNRALYPPNWQHISMAVRLHANWTCQRCNRPCRLPGEPLQEFRELIEEFAPLMPGDMGDRFLADLAKPGRFVLTVAHLDGDPRNNQRSNLMALCAVCHLQHDVDQHLQRRRERQRQQEAAAHQERGQLELF